MRVKKPDIKIFVSHRIDRESKTVDNPLYVPVRCGAVYDKRENVNMLGDNTGDNISEKRLSFCELTVQYWAWKNVEADYYGLCHYRRYIGFSDEMYETGKSESNNGCVVEEAIDEETIIKHCLNEKKMCEEITSCDIIAINPIEMGNITNYESMRLSPDYHNMDDVDLAIDIIERNYPHMIDSVEKYMKSDTHTWLYNCWIMKKEVFKEYSEWLFDVLNQVEKKIDNKFYSQQMLRTPGTLGERLYGIYLTYLMEQKKYNIKFKQLVFFNETSDEEIEPFFDNNNIAIASNFNNNYVPIFSVLLQSIVENSKKENNYDVIILGQDITEENIKLLNKVVERKSNFNVRIVNPKRYLDGLNKYVNNQVYTEDMYTRVLIPHILKRFDKILVLDADMIALRDVAEVYQTDLSHYYAAAVRDTVYQGYLNGMVPDTLHYARKVLKLTEPYNYCNTGLILFNCKKIRENFTLRYLQNYISTHQYRIYEQDTLNVLLDKKIYFLSQNWNLYTYNNDFVKKCVTFAPFHEQQKYLEARKDPYIIHYAAHPKPWWVGLSDFSFEFWNYARKSPFYEKILFDMCKHATNNIENKISGQISADNNIVQNDRSRGRKIADKIIPNNSMRHKIWRKLIPKDTRRWRLLQSLERKLKIHY